jgi:hypothetical protein
MLAPRELLWRDGGIFMASTDAGIKAQSKIAERLYKADRAERYPRADGLLSFLEEGQERHPVGAAELAAAGRIVKEARLKKIDKKALWQAIKKAHAASEIRDKYRPAPRLNKCLDDLQNLQNAARQLEVLLCRDNDATDFITSTRNGAELIYEFLNLKAWIDGSYDRLKEESRNRDRRGSAIAEWLAGVELPRVYEEFSGCGLPEGYPVPHQMVAFVESAMTELGFSLPRFLYWKSDTWATGEAEDSFASPCRAKTLCCLIFCPTHRPGSGRSSNFRIV